MAYYYVKSGGTATGDGGRYGTQQTGTFAALGASGYYDNIADCSSVATTAPAQGDFICVSDLHTHNYTANVELLSLGYSDEDPVFIISVSDTAIDSYSAGAVESSTITDIIFKAMCAIHGVSFTVGDDFVLQDNDAEMTLRDLTLTASGSGDKTCSISSGSTILNFEGVTFSSQSLASVLFLHTTGGSRIFLKDCIGTGTAGYAVVDVSGVGGTLDIVGCDFSAVAYPELIRDNSWSTMGSNPVVVHFDRCKLHADTIFSDTAPVGRVSSLLVTNSAATSGAAEYQYFYTSHGSQVEDETGIYRDNSTAFPSGTNTSLKCTTGSVVTPQRPFDFEMPTRYAELSNTATDTLRIYFMSATALDDGDVWAEVIYPDGTDKHEPNYKASVTEAFDPFRTAGSLDTNTEAWTGRTSENRYQIDLDTSGDAGADCVPIIRVYVAKASTTIYFDTSVDLL